MARRHGVNESNRVDKLNDLCSCSSREAFLQQQCGRLLVFSFPQLSL